MQNNTKTVSLSDIVISGKFKKHPPSVNKIARCYDYYKHHNGRLERINIVVGKGNILEDGYVSYLIYKMFGVEEIEVIAA